jgi:Arc/MetJ-type ribon-helix-helix transcriptional regulator
MEGLSAKSKAYIKAKIRSGEYPNEEAVLVAAIEALKRQEEARKREIELGAADARAGHFSDLNAIEIGEIAKAEILRSRKTDKL